MGAAVSQVVKSTDVTTPITRCVCESLGTTLASVNSVSILVTMATRMEAELTFSAHLLLTGTTFQRNDRK